MKRPYKKRCNEKKETSEKKERENLSRVIRITVGIEIIQEDAFNVVFVVYIVSILVSISRGGFL